MIGVTTPEDPLPNEVSTRVVLEVVRDSAGLWDTRTIDLELSRRGAVIRRGILGDLRRFRDRGLVREDTGMPRRTGPRWHLTESGKDLLGHLTSSANHDPVMSRLPARPDRSSVEQVWLSVLRGDLDRREVHEWASPWLANDTLDLMVTTALQHLHGFALRRQRDTPSVLSPDADGDFVHTMSDIESALARWRRQCREHDQDPEAFKGRARRLAVELLAQESQNRPEP